MTRERWNELLDNLIILLVGLIAIFWVLSLIPD